MDTTSTDTIGQAHARVSPDEVVARVRELIPVLRDRIAMTERSRQLPDSTVQDALAAGVFSLLLPASLGGSAGDIRDFVNVVRLLAQGDPTAAWTLGFLTEHNWMLARYPAAVQDEVFAAGGPVLMGAVANPPGQAIPVDGGFLVSGYWGYCSGIMNATWVQVVAVIEGRARPSLFLVPRSEVEIQDTWYMSGMKGSGSNDVKTDSVFVPGHRTADIDVWHSRYNHGASLHPEPLYAYDARDLLVFIIPALVIGAAETLLELYRGRLDRRRAAFSSTLTGDTVEGQLRYARSVSSLRAARALLNAAMDSTIAFNAHSSDEMPDELRALIKLDCMQVCDLAWQSIDLGVRGSGSAIYRSSDVTQHFIRDIQTILGHLTIDEDGMQAKAGEILLSRAASDADPARNFT